MSNWINIESGKWGILAIISFGFAWFSLGPIFAFCMLLFLLLQFVATTLTAQKHELDTHATKAVPLPYLFSTLGNFVSLKSAPKTYTSVFFLGLIPSLTGFAIGLTYVLVGMFLEGGSGASTDTFVMTYGQPWIARFLQSTFSLQASEHPIALAGSACLFISCFNLFPVGQLYGGHIAYGLLGKHVYIAHYIAMALMLAFGIFFHPFWYILLLMTLVYLYKHPEPKVFDKPEGNESRLWLLLLGVLFAISFTTVPFDFVLS